jgi:hypothetical protein
MVILVILYGFIGFITSYRSLRWILYFF